MKATIHRMTQNNLDAIMVIENLSFHIPWSRNAFIEELTQNHRAYYIVACVDGGVVGYAGMWQVFDEGHITNIAVHPEFRRNGVGSALMEGLVAAAREQGISRMTLEVRKSNITAQNLYSRFGFREGGLRKGYYADNHEDALIMWKENI